MQFNHGLPRRAASTGNIPHLNKNDENILKKSLTQVPVYKISRTTASSFISGWDNHNVSSKYEESSNENSYILDENLSYEINKRDNDSHERTKVENLIHDQSSGTRPRHGESFSSGTSLSDSPEDINKSGTDVESFGEHDVQYPEITIPNKCKRTKNQTDTIFSPTDFRISSDNCFPSTNYKPLEKVLNETPGIDKYPPSNVYNRSDNVGISNNSTSIPKWNKAGFSTHIVGEVNNYTPKVQTKRDNVSSNPGSEIIDLQNLITNHAPKSSKDFGDYQKESKDSEQVNFSSSSDPKQTSIKMSVFTLIIVLVLLCTTIAFFITTLVYYNGDEDSAIRYYRRVDRPRQTKLIDDLLQLYNPHGKINNIKSLGDLQALTRRNFTEGIYFNGIAYSPLNSMEPHCGTTLNDVELDLSVLSSVTNKLKTYGTQCNQNKYILETFQNYNLNMTLAMGVWISSNNTVNQQQLDTMKSLLTTYPRKLFDSIYIGNEVLFREDKTRDELIEIIKSVKNFVKQIGYNDLPVGTSDLGSLADQELLKECDIFGANIHPFFGGGLVQDATNWTIDFLNYQINPLNKYIKTKIVISEVGWPYKGGYFQSSIANKVNFQIFLNNWVCEMKDQNYDFDWYYFEAFDEPWKELFYEGNNRWETEFGIFDKNRQMKSDITFPKC